MLGFHGNKIGDSDFRPFMPFQKSKRDKNKHNVPRLLILQNLKEIGEWAVFATPPFNCIV